MASLSPVDRCARLDQHQTKLKTQILVVFLFSF
jgi:hypothetical protein